MAATSSDPAGTDPATATPAAGPQRSARLAFGFGVPIGALGGLIGLGGAEFRLPVLTGVLRYQARPSVALNLAISLVTVTTALLVRAANSDLTVFTGLLPVAGAIIVGAVVAAYVGVDWVHRTSEDVLRRAILVLLLAIGVGLIIEAFTPSQVPGLFPDLSATQLAIGALFGLLIGLVSSMLGVAGGEVIIPTLVFVFGADIVVAGTLSLAISLPTVAVGVARHARRSAYTDPADRRSTIAPMGAGSVIGALIGGSLIGIAPRSAIELLLGVILIVSALRVFRH